MKTILLIEDDNLLGAGLHDYLIRQGYKCQWLTGSENVDQHWYGADLVILDRQLRDGDSLRLLPHWLMRKAVPVIILTARVEVGQRVEGLQAGANDYVLKPFAHEELLARIQVQLRSVGSSQIRYADLEVDVARHAVMQAGQAVTLKPKEFQLLVLLLQNPDRVYHRDELLNKIWGYQSFPTTRTVDNHILHLRQKLPGLAIETLRGVGYRLRGAEQ